MTLPPDTIRYLVYALAAAAAILVVEVLYLQLVRRRNRGAVNRRLRKAAEGEVQAQDNLKQLLRERGLTESGDYLLGLIWLNRLYAQSGITGNPLVYLARFVGVAAILAIAVRLFGYSLYAALALFLLVGLALPFWRLRRARLKRLRTFERQLPDALDMIVRSLRAGHPVSVAIGLVGRELSDPVGTEFGIAYDEVTFGAQLETAVARMAERVGFEGLQLLSVALSIQSKTGGNLTEILSNLSQVLRSRMILRMKVRSLASEGKMSAIMMSIFPVAMFLILQLIAPSYYGKIWDNPMVLPVMAGFGAWALFGDFIMYRMVNFDF
ncbi:MAG TPA: type II secretion system F family protein [Devosia sp.]|nr:type II secretion system F family protein [Devosia sp.]